MTSGQPGLDEASSCRGIRKRSEIGRLYPDFRNSGVAKMLTH